MNRTQKNTWFALVESIFSLSVLGIIFIRIFWIPKPSHWESIHLLWPIVAAALVFALFFVRRKKQSPIEPENDERDRQIQQRAVITSYISIWLFLLSRQPCSTERCL